MCRATLIFRQNDWELVFECKLDEGHEGLHQETNITDGMVYLVSWPEETIIEENPYGDV